MDDIMNDTEFEDWESLEYHMDAEGFHYCFDGYSDWNEIKDEKFHELRTTYLKSMNELRNYITKVVEDERENR
jgi:hypothetical protein